MKLEIKACRDYAEEPVFIPAEVKEDMVVRSAVADNGVRFPAQKVEGGIVVIAEMKRGETLTLTPDSEPVLPDIELKSDEAKSSLDIVLNNELFTSYVYDKKFAKPYLGPVLAKDGTSYTRLDFETREHPHQRSVFTGVGDVNGVDFWNERENFGYQTHQGFSDKFAGPACAGFTADILWHDKDKKPFMDEKRTYTFYNQSSKCRYVDITFRFTASYGEVKFGPTKEAGPLGVRINEKLRADRGGYFVNSYGAELEEECWGRAASWCDYYGTINDRLYGIAVFDNEKNERYPTTWHIRNYGLFAANNLFFKGGLVIPEGESLTYRYRLCFYEGEHPNIRDRFIIYALMTSQEAAE
jgi:hypothetical protein